MRGIHWLLGAVAALVLALGVSACGSADDDGDAASAADGTATTATAAGIAGDVTCEGIRATYQLSFFPNAQYVGPLVAVDRGYFAEEGIDLELKPGGPTVNPALQLAQGNVDFADMPLSDAYNAAANGGRIVLIGQSTQQNPIRFISFKDEAPLKSPEDLKGKSVGAQQAGNLAPELKGLLDSVGLSDSDITIRQISFNVDDFVARRVEVFPARVYAHFSMLEAKGFRYPDDFDTLDPNEHGAGVADEGEYINRDFYDKHPEAAVCFLRAVKRGWETALEDPEAGVAAVKRFAPRGAFTDRDIEVGVREMLVLASTNPNGEPTEPTHIDVDYITESVRLLHDAGVVRGDVDLDEFIDTAPQEAITAVADGSDGDG